jgi:hypothetical protein
VGIPMDVMPQLLQKPPDPPDINARTDPNILISNVKEYYFIVYISTFNSHSNGKPLNGGEERCHLAFNKQAKVYTVNIVCLAMGVDL